VGFSTRLKKKARTGTAGASGDPVAWGGRLLEPIGNIPPAEAEERYYAMLEQPAMAA
jgi:hypothetical protein